MDSINILVTIHRFLKEKMYVRTDVAVKIEMFIHFLIYILIPIKQGVIYLFSSYERRLVEAVRYNLRMGCKVVVVAVDCVDQVNYNW